VRIENLRLLRGLASLYGGRPGFLGSLRLARLVLGHIVATGGSHSPTICSASSSARTILRRLSRRLGEGAFNGALTARIGVAAIEVIRPLPFLAAQTATRARHPGRRAETDDFVEQELASDFAMPPTIQSLLIGFVMLLVAFRLLDCCGRRRSGSPCCGAASGPMLTYWAFTPLVTRAITRACVVVAIVPVALLIYGKVDKELLLHGSVRPRACRCGCRPPDPGARRFRRLLDAPLVPWATPVALPCRAPLLRRPRLAVGRAPAPGQRCADARGRERCHLASALRRWPWPASRRC
jgi:hypothetical protein